MSLWIVAVASIATTAGGLWWLRRRRRDKTLADTALELARADERRTRLAAAEELEAARSSAATETLGELKATNQGISDAANRSTLFDYLKRRTSRGKRRKPE